MLRLKVKINVELVGPLSLTWPALSQSRAAQFVPLSPNSFAINSGILFIRYSFLIFHSASPRLGLSLTR